MRARDRRGTGPDAWGAVAVGFGPLLATVLVDWQVFKTKEL